MAIAAQNKQATDKLNNYNTLTRDKHATDKTTLTKRLLLTVVTQMLLYNILLRRQPRPSSMGDLGASHQEGVRELEALVAKEALQQPVTPEEAVAEDVLSPVTAWLESEAEEALAEGVLSPVTPATPPGGSDRPLTAPARVHVESEAARRGRLNRKSRNQRKRRQQESQVKLLGATWKAPPAKKKQRTLSIFACAAICRSCISCCPNSSLTASPGDALLFFFRVFNTDVQYRNGNFGPVMNANDVYIRMHRAKPCTNTVTTACTRTSGPSAGFASASGLCLYILPYAMFFCLQARDSTGSPSLAFVHE